jgi:hypothetical protein
LDELQEAGVEAATDVADAPMGLNIPRRSTEAKECYEAVESRVPH